VESSAQGQVVVNIVLSVVDYVKKLSVMSVVNAVSFLLMVRNGILLSFGNL